MSFKPAPIPENEKNRLKAVERTGVMDIVNEELYDVYTHLARKITGCPNSWANIIDKDNQFNLVMDSDDLDDKIKNQFRKIDRNISFCQYALGSTKPLNVISPVIATSLFMGISVIAEMIDVTIPIPADGPSLGVAPSGTCM